MESVSTIFSRVPPCLPARQADGSQEISV